MTPDGKEIEVEVLEVENTVQPDDGDALSRSKPGSADWREWRQWQGRVRMIDSRWWPLWVIPAIILLILATMAAMVIGVLAVVFLLCRNLLRALLR